MRVLVLGGYGLIGLEIVRALYAAGHEVVVLGRSAASGKRLFPVVPWLGADIAGLTRPDAWAGLVAGFDAVINASGALQDGAKDNLARVQDEAIRALITACEQAGVSRFVQISAPGAEPRASTAFLRTKAAADAALRASSLEWTILKPGLVVSAGAYGGMALVRMLAAFPVVQPLVLADARIQTVAASDVARAVLAVLAGEVAPRGDYELVEDGTHSLAELTAAFRVWSGRQPARSVWRLPRWLGGAIAWGADMAGWLGWRSPLRTTALKSLDDGVTGDAAAWKAAGGFRLNSLSQTLAALPSTMQERVFGRAQLVYPVALLTLAVFWIVSGVVGFVRLDAAAGMIAGQVGDGLARMLTIGGGLADIAIGCGLLYRPTVRAAAWASVGLSAAYLAAGSVLTPELWADPLGVFVKVFPAMALAVVVAALTEER